MAGENYTGLIVQWERRTEDFDGHEKTFVSKWHVPYWENEDCDTTACEIEIPRTTRDADVDVYYISNGAPTCKRCFKRINSGNF